MSGSLIICTPFFVAAPLGQVYPASTPMGIVAGGRTPTTTAVTSKFDFDTQSIAITTSLSVAKSSMSSASNGDQCVIQGGHDGTNYLATTEKFIYHNESTISGSSINERFKGIGFGTPSVGYFAGGRSETYANNSNDINTYDFSTDSVSPLTNTLVRSLYIAGYASSPTYGIVFGGFDEATGAATNNTEYFTYSTETSTSGSAFSGTARYEIGGASGNTFAYFFGGRASTIGFSDIWKYTLATHAKVVSTSFATGTLDMQCFSDDVAAYSAGGSLRSSPYRVNYIEQVPYSTSTRVRLSATLNAPTHTGIGNSNVHGGLQ